MNNANNTADANDVDLWALLAECGGDNGNGIMPDEYRSISVDAEFVAAANAALAAREAEALRPRPQVVNGVRVVDCPKCGGAGSIYAYHHIDHGRCWRCLGRGVVAR